MDRDARFLSLLDIHAVREAVAAGSNVEVIELLQPLLLVSSVHDILPSICGAAKSAMEDGDDDYAETMFRLAVYLYSNCFVADHANGLKAIEGLEQFLRCQHRLIDLEILHRQTRVCSRRARRHLHEQEQGMRPIEEIPRYYRRGA